MLKHIARAISLVFHPFWMPIAGIFILLTHSRLAAILPAEGHQAVYIIVISSTIGLPLLMFPIYWFRKSIKTLEMSERQERYIPLFIMSVFYFFSFYTLRNLNAPSFLSGFILGAFVSVAVAAIVNVWWKISLHGIGFGGILALLTLMAFFQQGNPEGLFFQALIYSGVALSARMYLNQHTLWQIVAGFSCGFFSIFFTLLIY